MCHILALIVLFFLIVCSVVLFLYFYYFFSFFFFFSSRRRHTRSLRDWSSDVCSSDLMPGSLVQPGDATCAAKPYVAILRGKNCVPILSSRLFGQRWLKPFEILSIQDLEAIGVTSSICRVDRTNEIETAVLRLPKRPEFQLLVGRRDLGKQRTLWLKAKQCIVVTQS